MKIELRPYQKAAASVLSAILADRKFALDGSDTGIGKTFTAIGACLRFDNPVAVICKARTLTKWKEALAQAGIEPVFLLSWEKARNGKNGFFLPLNSKGHVSGFNLQLKEPTIVIIDEIHCGGALKSLNAELVIACKRCPNAFTLGLSATVADSPLKMRAIGFCCELHALGNDFWNWCRRNGCGKSPFGGLYFRQKDRERVLKNLHNHLFGQLGCWGIRLRKKELMQEGSFPESEVYVELWDPPKSLPAWAQAAMAEIDQREEEDMEKFDGNPHGGILHMRNRQRAEIQKLPSLVDEIEDRLSEGESIIVFVQFTRTIQVLSKQLEHVPHAIISGATANTRIGKDGIAYFQQNQIKLIICQVDAAAEGIDLHDTHGDHPRHVIMFPTYKAITLIQALGRAVRANAKSPVVQRIVYSSEGIEEKIARTVEKKLENLSMLSDGELNAGGML